MKYKLISKTTDEEHLCDKVTIDGFDYYVNDEKYFDDNGEFSWVRISDVTASETYLNVTYEKLSRCTSFQCCVFWWGLFTGD